MAELLGWLAAALTLLAFSMRSMIALRVAAIAANFCFIAYGLMGGLAPVLALHLLLLPCNVLRLGQLFRVEDRDSDAPARQRPVEYRLLSAEEIARPSKRPLRM